MYFKKKIFLEIVPVTTLNINIKLLTNISSELIFLKLCVWVSKVRPDLQACNAEVNTFGSRICYSGLCSLALPELCP